MALTEYELNLIDEQIDAYCRMIKRIRKQMLELERKKLSINTCEFCSFEFDIVKKNGC